MRWHYLLGESCSARLAFLVFCFVFGMLLFEICMEALFSLPDVPRTMSLWNTTVQFTFCAIIPAISTLINGKWRSARRHLDLELGSSTDPSKANAEPAADSAAEARLGVLGLMRFWAPFVGMSAMQFAAGVAANHSVHYVDFTMKVVFKASKLLPTMAMSSFIGNSRAYSTLEYLAALLLCTGTAMFSCGGSKEGPVSGSSGEFTIGVLLLLFAVLLDGIMPNMQQALLRGGCPPDVLTMRINIVGALGGIGGLVFSGDWLHMAAYVEIMPNVVPLLFASGLTFSASIMSYMRLIEEAGSVYAVGVSTVRKSATVALSFMLFPGKAFSAVRGLGLATLLGGLVLAELEAARTRRKAPGRSSLQEKETSCDSMAHLRVRGG